MLEDNYRFDRTRSETVCTATCYSNFHITNHFVSRYTADPFPSGTLHVTTD